MISRALVVALCALSGVPAMGEMTEGLWAPLGHFPEMVLEPIAQGLQEPVAVVPTPSPEDNRLFILEQSGRVRMVKDGALLPTPVLDITQRVLTGTELGLLGIAPHPDFARNAFFYIYWTRMVEGTIYSVVTRHTMGAESPDEADAASEAEVLTFAQINVAHQSGCMQFGPHDGYLYIAAGDGGRREQAQMTTTLLGNILRIDVDGGVPYAIPPSNPFAGVEGFRPEIFAFGVRNVWRFGFDRETGDLYFADVGRNMFEEVNVLPASSGGGQNYGWPIAEGYACFDADDNHFGECGLDEGLTPPLVAFSNSDRWRAIVGGYAYRGKSMPALRGYAIFGEYATQRIAALRWTPDLELPLPAYNLTALLDRTGTPLNGISSFGEDNEGELMVCSRNNGRVYRLAPKYHRTDLNRDGEVNAVDVQMVINAALGSESEGAFPDVNGDGAVNAVDVQLVINFALGL